MLKSSFLLVFFLNLYFYSVKEVLGLTFILILINLFYNKNFFKNFKQIKLFALFYLTTCVFHFVFNQNGEVITKILGIYITKEGLNSFIINFMRIFNLLLLSWIANYKGIFKSGLGKYQRIVENVVWLVPEVITGFKKKIKLKWFFRYILNRLNSKNLEIK